MPSLAVSIRRASRPGGPSACCAFASLEFQAHLKCNHLRRAVSAQSGVKQVRRRRRGVSQCSEPGLRRKFHGDSGQCHVGKFETRIIEYTEKLRIKSQFPMRRRGYRPEPLSARRCAVSLELSGRGYLVLYIVSPYTVWINQLLMEYNGRRLNKPDPLLVLVRSVK